jgi:hypothetical protein
MDNSIPTRRFRLYTKSGTDPDKLAHHIVAVISHYVKEELAKADPSSDEYYVYSLNIEWSL